MSTALKCPNPGCPYLFDPTAVPPGVVLACPRCGMRFTLGPPPPPAAPAANFPPAPPAARTPPPRRPASFDGMTPAAADADRADGEPPPGGGSKLQTMMLVGVAAVALAAAGVAVWWKVSTRNAPDAPPEGSGAFRNKDLNLIYDAPPGQWERDDETRARLGAPYFVVFKRANPEAYVALGGRAFDANPPRPRELREVVTQPLAKLLDRDSRKMYPDAVDRSWFGRDAWGFKFTGLLKGAGAVEGEGLAVVHKGATYWFLAWAPADEYAGLKDAFAEVRRRCRLIDPRKNLEDKSPPLVAYKNNVLGYSLYDPEGIWTEVTDEEDLKYEGADKLLRAALGRKKDIQREAALAVYVVPGGGEPSAEAVRVVKEKRTAQIAAANPDFKVEYRDRPEPPEDVPANTVARSSEVVRFASTVKGSRGQDRLHAVSAARAGDKLVVVHAWCDWADRDDFEGVFVEIVGSLKVAG